MPLGKVFDARENQVLFSPVSNYYQGKAIRLALKNDELFSQYKENEITLQEQEISDAPATKKAAEKKAAADYALVLENIRAKKLSSSEEELDQYRDIVGPWVQEYGKQSKEDPEAALDWANQNFVGVLERLPPEKQKEFLEAAGPDFEFSFDELSRIGLGIRIYEADKNPDPTSHQQVLDDLVVRKFITEKQRNEILKSQEVKAGTVTGTTDLDPSVRVTGDKTLDREIVKADVATRNLVDLVKRTKAQIKNIKQAGMGITGKVVRGLDEAVAEVTGIAEAIGGTEWIGGNKVPAGSLLDINLYEWTGSLASASAAVKSNMITLSYLKARSFEPAGRLAKDDVKLARDSLGGNYASKAKINAALDETTWQALNGLRNYYKATNNIKKFPADLYEMLDSFDPDKTNNTPSDELETDGVPEGIDPRDWEFMTPEQKAIWN